MNDILFKLSAFLISVLSFVFASISIQNIIDINRMNKINKHLSTYIKRKSFLKMYEQGNKLDIHTNIKPITIQECKYIVSK